MELFDRILGDLLDAASFNFNVMVAIHFCLVFCLLFPPPPYYNDTTFTFSILIMLIGVCGFF